MNQEDLKRRVLVVDDQEDFAEGIAEVLDINGYETKVTFDQKSARELLKHEDFQVALVDLRLGNTSGLDLIDALKTVRPGILCLIMTAYADVDTAIEAVHRGAYDYLRKPLNTAELLANLDRCYEKIRLEEEKRDRELAYATLFNNLLDVFFRTDMEGNILEVSPSFEGVLGYAVDQAPSLNFRRDLFSNAENGDRFFQLVQQKSTLKLYEARFRHRNGHEVPLSINARHSLDTSGNVVGVEGIARDITEVVSTRAELTLLAAAIDQAAELIFITDTEGNFQYVNPSFERVTGYSKGEVIGKNVRLLKSGKQNEAFYRELWHTITRGLVWHGKLINKRRDGTYYTEEGTITPVRGEDGKIVSYVAVKRDITRLAMLEGQLRQAQKMEAIGTLAGGIAHDFNNILSSIMGYSELAILDSPDGSRPVQHLNKVLHASHRAKDLVNQILNFSRREEHELVPVDIKNILYDTLKLMRASLPTTIDIRRTISAEERTVLADQTQIHQVVMNMCANAQHAMRETGGVLEIRLEDAVADKDFVFEYPELNPKDYVLLSIRDTGHGMDEEMLERIFDPYFTTKEKGEGTGLGLAIVHNAIQNHNGRIRVWSEPGKGTAFFIYLPLAPRDIPAQLTESSSEQIPGGRERILVVDDEEDIVLILKNMLTRLGYKVVTYHKSKLALKKFKENPAAFDVVISDMTMPEMTGVTLTTHIKEIRPDIPVLLCTGFSELLPKDDYSSIGVAGILMKPIAMMEMATTLRNVLDRESPTEGGTTSKEN